MYFVVESFRVLFLFHPLQLNLTGGDGVAGLVAAEESITYHVHTFQLLAQYPFVGLTDGSEDH